MKGNALFSCTTFLAKPGKLMQLTAALRSVEGKLDYEHAIVVNEPGSIIPANLIAEFPKTMFVQKTPAEKGQAKSLNIILDYIDALGCEWWFQWEESWVLKAAPPMLPRDVDQLQLTDDWRDVRGEVRGDLFFPARAQISGVPACEMWRACSRLGGFKNLWPLFSLRPSLNRVASIGGLRFSENPAHFPIIFEFEFASRWCTREIKKAVFKEGIYAVRQPNHVSTYH